MIYGRNSHNGTYKTINCINVVCVVFEPLFFIAMYMFEIKKNGMYITEMIMDNAPIGLTGSAWKNPWDKICSR
jgi:hypothetical protein